ncbi:insulinase family protein [Parendozoicomonas sp. Alg238-R29]|uniref:insulinase family protein n=1 Tax=Parendozoicomonas sp. Alg238-R29 TaxID=2993446 RepID=UPI00248EB84B|nr:insulinase family protein [Parendozoicomonas sp. Alg238-R29]
MYRFLKSFVFFFLALFLPGVASAAPAQYPEIVKSPHDTRSYRYLELENGVKVVLVHAPGSETAAAAVGVHAGHQQTPEEWPGLAHLLEHMLFLGSEKYPDVDSFDGFISEQGGFSNAFTSETDTVYYVNLPDSKIFPALERMSWFFIAPLMNPEYLDRERHAVDAEFQIYRQKDTRRIYQVEKATLNPKHPMHRFAVGNLQTLQDHNGLILRDALLKFHKDWYVGENISISVVSGRSLDDMELSIKTLFSKITDRASVHRQTLPPKYTDNEVGIRIDVQSQQQHKQMDLIFPLPANKDYLKEKNTLYITHLLAHEAKGSLNQVLKDKGWIQGMNAWGEDNGVDAVLRVALKLTEEGYKHIEAIAGQVFSYIKLIQENGVTQKYFDELQRIQELRFRFLGEASPENTAVRLVTAMPDLPPDQLIQSRFLIHQFKPEKIKKTLSRLTHKNMRLRVISNTIPPVSDNDILSEPWTGTHYSLRKLTPEQKKLMVYASPDPELSLPPLNPFMPEDLTVLKEESAPLPELLSRDKMEVWFKHDNQFNLPRSEMYVQFIMSQISEAPRQKMLFALFSNIMDSNHSDSFYQARLADLDYGLDSENQGFVLTVSGFNDRLPMFFLTLLERLKNFSFEDDAFEQEKAAIIESLSNADFQDPLSHLVRAFAKIRYQYSSSPEEALAELNTITASELRTWHETLFTNFSMKVLFHGNMTRKSAESLMKSLSDFAGSPVSKPRDMVRKIPLKLARGLCYRSYSNSDSSFFQITSANKKDMKTRAAFRILTNLLHMPFYTQLRTNEQLGYTVMAQFWEDLSYPSLAFFVQSPDRDPDYLDQRTNSFLTTYQEIIRSIDQEQLDNVKKGMIANLLKPNTSLSAQTVDYWNDLSTGFIDFDQTKQLVKAIENFTVADLQQVYSVLLSGQSQLKIYGYSKGHEPDMAPLSCDEPVFLKQFSEIIRH